MLRESQILILAIVCCLKPYAIFGQEKKYTSIGDSRESIKQIVSGNNGDYFMALTKDNVLQCWEIDEMSLFKSQQLRDISAGFSLSPNNTALACGTLSGEIQLRDFPSLELKHTLSPEVKQPASKVVWANQDSLVILHTDNSLSLISVKDHRSIYNQHLSESKVTSLDVSVRLNLIALSDVKGRVTLRKLSNGSLVRTIKVHSKWIRQVKIDEERAALVSVSDDGRCSVISINNDMPLFKRKRYFTWLTAVDVYQKSILLTSSEGFVEIVTPFNSYDTNIHAVITSASFIRTNESNQLIVCVGTLGKGIVLVKASEMKIREKLRSPQPQVTSAVF